mgnify:CR=1 FL=1|jgi:cysteine desulfurase
MKIRYFDHAATTSVDEEVLNAMIPYFSENYGNPSSLYSIGKENKEVINLARMKIATILNCKVNEIYFTSGGTESDNMIIKGIAFANKRYGNHIITSKIEHHAVLNTCEFLERFGFRVTYLTPNSKGIINPADVERAITRNTILISIMYANNEIGTIQPVEKIGEIAKRYGVYFHTDSVQAVGNEKIDIKKSNIEALSISGHKFYGPKGIGIAYINEKINFMTIQDGGHQERDKRGGTENVPGIVGITKALEIANANLTSYNRHLKELRNYYISEIQKRIPNIKINGDMNSRLSGNANISFSGIDGNKLVEMLAEKGICTSSGSACSAGFVNSSHVLLAIGMPNFLAKSALRVTFGKENTIDDTKFLLDSIEESVKILRKI